MTLFKGYSPILNMSKYKYKYVWKQITNIVTTESVEADCYICGLKVSPALQHD